MNKPNILYVEDDPTSRRVMEVILEHQLGLSDFVIFEDSSYFLEKLASLKQKPDIIFLDINIKPLDGFDMLDVLRKHPDYRKVTTLALTASVMNEEIEQLQQAGFDGAISKPLNKDLFPGLVERILAGEKIWHVV